jgi:hypothetical protein
MIIEKTEYGYRVTTPYGGCVEGSFFQVMNFLAERGIDVKGESMISSFGTMGKKLTSRLVDFKYNGLEGSVNVFSEVIPHDRGQDIETYVEPVSGCNQLTEEQLEYLTTEVLIAVENNILFVEIDDTKEV